MFETYKRERNVRKALKALARQRVAMVLPDGGLVIELCPPRADWFDEAVRTAHLRGWVEVLHHSIPNGQLTFVGNQPRFPDALTAQTMYRLTEGGWTIIRRSHGWVIATFAVAVISLVASLAGIAVTLVTANVEHAPSTAATSRQTT